MELTAAFSPPSSPSPQTTPTMSSTELPPNLPSAWLAYMDRVQSATDKIQNVLEDRSQSNSTTMYAGECIVVERSIVVINQFVCPPPGACARYVDPETSLSATLDFLSWRYRSSRTASANAASTT